MHWSDGPAAVRRHCVYGSLFSIAGSISSIDRCLMCVEDVAMNDRLELGDGLDA